MKLLTFSFEQFLFEAALMLLLCHTNPAGSKPAINSIEALPDPLNPSQDFTIEVATSPDVTEAWARVDFHPGEPHALEIPLTVTSARPGRKNNHIVYQEKPKEMYV
jgi:hypothetical protein